MEIIVPDDREPGRATQVSGAVIHGLVDHVPADDDAGIVFLQIFHDAFDIVFQAAEHDLTGHIFPTAAIALPEEFRAGLAVPDQRVAVHLHTVGLCPVQQGLRTVKMNGDRSFVLPDQLPAGSQVEHGIRLQLVLRRYDIELGADEAHERRVHGLHHIDAAAEIEFAGIDVLQGGHTVHRGNDHRGFRGPGLRLPVRSGDGEAADAEGQGARTDGFHIEREGIVIPGRVSPLQSCPFTLLRGAARQILIAGGAVDGVGDGDHEGSAVQLLLQDFHAQLVIAARNEGKVPPGRIP